MRLKNATGILACGLLILGLTIYLSPSTLPSIAPARAAARTIYLIGNYPNWNISNTNPTITVTKGDTITIVLSSSDTAHLLLIDFDSDYTGGTDCTTVANKCSNTFGPSNPTQLGPFTVTSNAGTYKYYCTIHYPAMQGLFVVQNPPASDFSIAANPSSLSIPQGSNDNSTITLSSINNFAGTITLSASPSPTGPVTSFNPNPVMVSSGTPATSKLTISIPTSTPQGSYSITVTGTNGSASGTHTTNISVSVVSPSSPNFTISASPTSLTIAQGSSGTISVTLTGTNGFSGAINLSDAVPANLTCGAIIPSSIANSGTAMVSCGSTNTATYTLTITGTSGVLSHSTTATFTVTDFTISANSPTSMTVGTSTASTITVAAVNGFTGTVTLTDTVPVNLTCNAISPTVVTNSGSAALSCSSTIAGNYKVNVTASSGSLSHSTTISFTVVSTNSPAPGNSSLPVLPIIGGIIGAVVVVGIAVFLIKRKP